MARADYVTLHVPAIKPTIGMMNDDAFAAAKDGLVLVNLARGELVEEAAVIAQTDVALDFGTFSISADGNWSYTVDVTNETVAALEVGNSVNDMVTITSIGLFIGQLESIVN